MTHGAAADITRALRRARRAPRAARRSISVFQRRVKRKLRFRMLSKSKFSESNFRVEFPSRLSESNFRVGIPSRLSESTSRPALWSAQAARAQG